MARHKGEFERYRVVRRKADLRLICEAVEASGGTVVSEPDPNAAPFEIDIRTQAGEALRLVCYAFHANKYRQKGRPSDEHRFQVKYGSDFTRYHRIFIAPEPDRVTLMLGVHTEERVFVAVDPAMHEITWFSRSIEFKDRHIAKMKRGGWFGWERERTMARRKQVYPKANYQDEVLLGFKPNRFLQYVQLERVACGLPPGERLTWIDRLSGDRKLMSSFKPHPLEIELGLPAHEILNLIDGAFRLKVAVRGSAAERHLYDFVKDVEGVTRADLIDADGRPDLEVVYRRRKPVFVECKNVLRRLTAGGPKVDFQKTRASKADPCSRYYRPSQFELLAACLHPVTDNWEFRFCRTRELDPHPKCEGRLSQRVLVDGDRWERPLDELLDEVSRR